jgi:hypothetical protein
MRSAYPTFVLPNRDFRNVRPNDDDGLDQGPSHTTESNQDRRHWSAGTRLVVEDTPNGVLLKLAPAFAPTRPEDVRGMLAHKGKSKMIEEMHAGIAEEVRRRHARGRY